MCCLAGSVITTRVYSMLTLFFSGVLPLFGILIMNLIILCVIKSSKFSKVKQSRNKRQINSSSKTANMHNKTIENRKPNIAVIDKTDKLGTSAICVHDVDLEESNTASKREKQLSTKQFNKKTKREQMMTARDRQLTVMTVVMTMAFLMCVPPCYLRAVLFFFLKSLSYDDMSPIRALVSVVTDNLLMLNSVINFFLYVMTGSKFRSDLTALFRLPCYRN